ncbi:MAG: hypothetical protein ACRCYU_01820 [Nocardioides sp.]
MTEVATILPMAGDDLLGFADIKINELMDVLRNASIVVGMAFVIVQAVMSRFAMARIVISALSAGLFVWIVWSVTDLKERVDNEVNSAPAPVAPSLTMPSA